MGNVYVVDPAAAATVNPTYPDEEPESRNVLLISTSAPGLEVLKPTPEPLTYTFRFVLIARETLEVLSIHRFELLVRYVSLSTLVNAAPIWSETVLELKLPPPPNENAAYGEVLLLMVPLSSMVMLLF